MAKRPSLLGGAFLLIQAQTLFADPTLSLRPSPGLFPDPAPASAAAFLGLAPSYFKGTQLAQIKKKIYP